MSNTHWLIILPGDSVSRHSMTFSCGDFVVLIDWHNQREIAAAVLISDGSMPTTLTKTMQEFLLPYSTSAWKTQVPKSWQPSDMLCLQQLLLCVLDHWSAIRCQADATNTSNWRMLLEPSVSVGIIHPGDLQLNLPPSLRSSSTRTRFAFEPALYCNSTLHFASETRILNYNIVQMIGGNLRFSGIRMELHNIIRMS